MTPTLDAAFRSWPFDPWLLVGLLLAATVYLRGWRVFFRRDPARWPVGRPAAFLGGLAAVYLALASPIEPFASLLLQVHMAQHLLLTMAAPPLIWLGHPLLPLVRGLPEPIRTYWVAPLFGVHWLRRLAGWLVRPATAWVLFIASTWVWHFPSTYDLALRDPRWHYVQHICFLAGGLLFWFPVVRPYPYRPAWPTWVLLPYLLLADVSNTVLSALLAFSDRVLYPHYLEVPRLGPGSALDDQSSAGVLMWVPGSVAFLLPLAAIGVKLLFGDQPEPRAKPAPRAGKIALPMANPPDVLRAPVLGRFLRWRHARPTLQLPLLLLAGLVVWDGFAGPPDAPRNLAGVLPWVHWRGLLVLGLLVAGNVFCTACPFVLPRTLARRFLPAGRAWPHRLRSKWLAAALLVLFFTAYEAFALWDRPAATAWIVVGYFVGAFAVDGLFRGAAFCKYFCPVGQFNFVQSLTSPLGVAVRDPSVCAACKTKDCIKACELGLNVPRKADNMDCTLCLDCVHACPYDNVGILPAAAPEPTTVRPDFAALVLVLVFAAFANAAGMTGPVLDWYERAARDTGLSPRAVVILVGVFTLTAVPFAAAWAASALSQRWGQLPVRPVDVACRFAVALVPLGFGMWLAHYGYHLLTSYESAWPVAQRFAADHGLNLGTPQWTRACCRPVGAWLPKLEIVFLDVGLLATLHAVYRAARGFGLGPARTVTVLLPWAVLAVGLFAAGVWVVLQPMDMRGTLAPAG